jgi:hypothetical protein
MWGCLSSRWVSVCGDLEMNRSEVWITHHHSNIRFESPPANSIGPLLGWLFCNSDGQQPRDLSRGNGLRDAVSLGDRTCTLRFPTYSFSFSDLPFLKEIMQNKSFSVYLQRLSSNLKGIMWEIEKKTTTFIYEKAEKITGHESFIGIKKTYDSILYNNLVGYRKATNLVILTEAYYETCRKQRIDKHFSCIFRICLQKGGLLSSLLHNIPLGRTRKQREFGNDLERSSFWVCWC